MAVEKAAEAASGAAKGVWGGTKWAVGNLTPLGSTGRVVWAVGISAAAFSVAAAPTVAWEAANLAGAEGLGSLTGKFMGLASEGAPVIFDIGGAVFDTLPGAWENAQLAAAQTAEGAATATSEITASVSDVALNDAAQSNVTQLFNAPAPAAPAAPAAPTQPAFDPNSMFDYTAEAA